MSAGDRLIVGCGYLGLEVARRWLREGHAVQALTRTPERAEQLAQWGLQPLLGDLTLPDSLPRWSSIETLLLAVGLDRRSGHSQREVYIEGLRHLIERCERPPRRVVSISSTSVYGQTAGEWVDENSPTEPVAENGRVCLEAEQLLRAHWPHACILRSAGIYGPGRLVARVDQLRAGVPLTGNPAAWLNMIHVQDLATAAVLCANRATPGGLFLAVDDRPVKRSEFYEQIAGWVGAPPIQFEPLPPTDPAATQWNKRCRNAGTKQALGWHLQFPTVIEGLAAVFRADAAQPGGPLAPREPRGRPGTSLAPGSSPSAETPSRAPIARPSGPASGSGPANGAGQAGGAGE